MDKVTLIRTVCFISIFAAVTLWELASPKRRLTVSKPGRWGNNLGIIVIDTLIARLLFPTVAVGVAAAAGQSGWGLLHVLQVSFVPATII
jgi:hypothetical protein